MWKLQRFWKLSLAVTDGVNAALDDAWSGETFNKEEPFGPGHQRTATSPSSRL
ncbi:hypothetical protein [Burkholderia ubonensis]|uniref:hypothetical protein n=1 Tax=Burkholderia ubonensis TaxID=101571 RepID=UPI000AF53E56|nr:hypothetical protein [Burkholderia ubonensis]